MNFNYSFSTSNRDKNIPKRKLSAQEEYWLDRILRNHSTQIFVVVVLFFALIISTIVYSIYYPNTSDNYNSGKQKIEINGSKIIITQ